jgi:type IV secretory pathway VirD2 relaxase
VVNDAFKPKLGRIGDAGRGKAIRFSTRVATETARHTLRRKGHIDPNAHRRGLATGAVAATGSFAPGTRRVVVRARYVRHVKGDLGPARAHLRYILRDGTTREAEPGRLYDAQGERADADAFLARSEGDPHQFRFIVSIEDSAQIADLRPVIRDMMRQMEQDLGTHLDWVAVDHFNTGHPHTHVAMRGRDERGQDLIIARDYIAHGLRARAQELETVELGPETELERLAKRSNEIGQERLTSLDRTLIRRSAENVLVMSAVPQDDGARRTQLVGRLRKLESLGLAKERRAGVWSLDPELEPKLRRLGERADKIKMMQRALAEVGLERSPGTLALFDRGTRKEALIGKVVGSGLVDEISDRSWVVIDGVDGRVHYVELGRLRPETVPPRGAVVRLVPDRLGGKPQSPPRLEVLARTASRELATHEGPIWIDRLVVDGLPSTQVHRGYGAELSASVEARRAWLVQHDLGRRTADGRFELRQEAIIGAPAHPFRCRRVIGVVRLQLGEQDAVAPMQGAAPALGRALRGVGEPAIGVAGMEAGPADAIELRDAPPQSRTDREPAQPAEATWFGLQREGLREGAAVAAIGQLQPACARRVEDHAALDFARRRAMPGPAPAQPADAAKAGHNGPMHGQPQAAFNQRPRHRSRPKFLG